MLGEWEGFVNIGESRYLFAEEMRRRNLPCSCGKVPGECAFWRGFDRSVQDQDVVWASRWLRAKYFPLAFMLWRTGRWRPLGLENFLRSVERIYRGTIDRTDARVIVDASKHPTYGLALTCLKTADVYVLHLVRDARAVVSSAAKEKGYLKVRRPLRTTLQWLTYNLASESITKAHRRYLRLRWEEVVEEPMKALHQIARAIGEPDSAQQLIAAGQERSWVFPVGEQHALAGNPEKLTAKERIILSPRDWELGGWDKLFVSCLTWPLLRRYGYAV